MAGPKSDCHRVEKAQEILGGFVIAGGCLPGMDQIEARVVRCLARRSF
jgi:hypothetical protein